jgi:hypothetical protein
VDKASGPASGPLSSARQLKSPWAERDVAAGVVLTGTGASSTRDPFGRLRLVKIDRAIPPSHLARVFFAGQRQWEFAGEPRRLFEGD